VVPQASDTQRSLPAGLSAHGQLGLHCTHVVRAMPGGHGDAVERLEANSVVSRVPMRGRVLGASTLICWHRATSPSHSASTKLRGKWP